MNWITDDWRLKLLALGLAILMLGAVAFSQNPPTIKTVQVDISYTLPTSNTLIVLSPPTRASVVVTGLADALSNMPGTNPPGLSANFDLTKAQPSPTAKATLNVLSRIPGVTVQNPNVPYVLNIDTLKTTTLTVTVRVLHVEAGWSVTKFEAYCPNTPCQVTFVGPASWETQLNAFADFTSVVNNTTFDFPNQSVQLVQGQSRLDLTQLTVPLVSLDPHSVEIKIEARTGTTSRSVPLVDATPTHPPAQGYRVIGITIDPAVVTVTGDANALALIKSIPLPAVDLSGKTSTTSFTLNITYPNTVQGSTQTATITYQIVANPNVSSSPTPSPSQ